MKRIIKKYPNRRLYDTHRSRYITIADIRVLVDQGIPLQVIEKPSGEDITRNILLQVINEQEQHGAPIMSEAFLEQVIRAHSRIPPGFLSRHLEKSLTVWLAQQNELLGQVREAVDNAAEPGITTNRQKVG